MPAFSVVASTIERRLLVNYRLDPGLARHLVPPGLRPAIVGDSAIGGFCLIRLSEMRPYGLPRLSGVRSENAAHRIAVEWDENGRTRRGMYIPERHSGSWLPRLAGGRVFPGVHQAAHFAVAERPDRIGVVATAPHLEIRADVTPDAPWSSSIFRTVTEASDFFAAASVGWSPRRHGGWDAVEMRTNAWAVRSTEAREISSTLLEQFPAGSCVFDHALLMSDIPVTWHALRRELTARSAAARAA